MGSTQERRSHTRFHISEAHAELIPEGSLVSFGTGRKNRAKCAVNLSKGGTRLVANEPLEPGHSVRVRLRMVRFDEEIESPGEVRWCSPAGGAESDYHVGIQFTGLKDAEVQAIDTMRQYYTSPQYRSIHDTRRKGSS